MNVKRNGARVGLALRVIVVILTVGLGVLLGGGTAVAGKAASATAWNWAATSTFWDRYGNPITPTLMPDPEGKRQGLVLNCDFAAWRYQFYCTNGSEYFHFRHGSDYTIILDVYSGCSYKCGTDVKIAEPSGTRTYECMPWDLTFTYDGRWHREAVHMEDFPGQTGEYLLLFSDQCGEGCWCLGDVRVTGGLGHISK